MKKPLIALALLALSLPLGCSGSEEEPDPLAKSAGFCEAWGKAACQEKVVTNCDAASVDDCVATQSAFCLDVIPLPYDSAKAKACLSAVKSAYRDAVLTAEEVQTVRYLAAPCDQLSAGVRDEGESCGSDDECATADGLFCIKKADAARGSCEKPELVAPGDACDGAAQVCEDGYFCNGENCVAYKKIGAACEGQYQCSPDQQCLTATDADGVETSTCAARLEINEVCASDADCQSGYCYMAAGATEGECASMIVLSRSEPLCDDLQ
jgi:hypothetical protein